MKKLRTTSMFVCLFGVFTLSGVVLGQERAQDRRAWIDENATTTDDPRRVPIAPGQQGPEGTLVHYASNVLMLRWGDVIATGSPSGVGAGRNSPVFMKKGDIAVSWIEGIGTLTNKVQ